MHRLNIDIPEELHARVQQRAAELGYAQLDEYVQSLIRDDVEVPVSEELEAELLKALRSPARELTPALWAEKRRQLVERFRQAKAG